MKDRFIDIDEIPRCGRFFISAAQDSYLQRIANDPNERGNG